MPAIVGVAAAVAISIALSSHLAAQSTTPGASQTAPAAPAQEQKKRRPSAANSFNRLLKKPAATSNAPPSEDGIHDPANPGTELLQWPSEAFRDLPKTSDGNRVDWVKALNQGLIAPWVDFDDPKAKPFTMDLVIVREVRGSMPDVVYPHQQHTEWLDCTNCHDDIFTPQKGANQISMASILLGRNCGVCHGNVAFPVSDCRRCHSRPKTKEQLRALAEKSAWRGKQAGRTGQ
ncbi:MAG: c(7)-type cytochrome triheme domain-containing protein [Rhodospirillales bacterium]